MLGMGGLTFILSLEDLVGIADTYPWPEEVQLCLPTHGGFNLQQFMGCLVVFARFLDYDFQLSLLALYKDFLHCWNLCLSQLSHGAS